MLMDMLGVMLGFVTVMLLLSLVVTGVVQMVMSTASLRLRNLEHGLVALIGSTTGGEKARVADAAKNMLSLRNLKIPDDSASGVSNENQADLKVRPDVAWINLEEFAELLSRADPGLADRVGEDLVQWFQRAEAYMNKRLVAITRYVTIAVSFAVAFVFQVSAPELLGQLSSDASLRAKYVSTGEKLLKDPDIQSAVQEPSITRAGLVAISKLDNAYPDLAAQFEEVSAKGATVSELRSELEGILSESSESKRSAVVLAYEKLVDQELENQRLQGEGKANLATGYLSSMDLEVFRYGIDFYFDKKLSVVRNWLGILMTTLLLTFGAPFWYERLKDVARLREIAQSKGAGQALAPAK